MTPEKAAEALEGFLRPYCADDAALDILLAYLSARGAIGEAARVLLSHHNPEYMLPMTANEIAAYIDGYAEAKARYCTRRSTE